MMMMTISVRGGLCFERNFEARHSQRNLEYLWLVSWELSEKLMGESSRVVCSRSCSSYWGKTDFLPYVIVSWSAVDSEASSSYGSFFFLLQYKNKISFALYHQSIPVLLSLQRIVSSKINPHLLCNPWQVCCMPDSLTEPPAHFARRCCMLLMHAPNAGCVCRETRTSGCAFLLYMYSTRVLWYVLRITRNSVY